MHPRTFFSLLAAGGILFCIPCHAQIDYHYQPNHYRAFGSLNSDLQILGVGTVLTLAALAAESPEQAVANLDEASLIDTPMDIGNLYGSAWTMAGLTVGFGVLGYATHERTLTHAAWDLGKSLLATSVVVGAVKVSVDRKRPNNAPYSFPSGHTAAAFAAAPVLHHHFGWQVGMTAYGLAAFTALGRMEENKHFLSDVIAGATIGLLTSRLLIRGRENISVFATPRRIGISYDF